MDLKEHFDGGLTCGVNVTDIKASMKWYQEVLGFELLYCMENLGWCELKSPLEKVNVGFSRWKKCLHPAGMRFLPGE